MKTLADLRRAMKPGTLWHTVNHAFNSDMGIRPVLSVHSWGVYFTTPTSKSGKSRLDFPKAADVQFSADGKSATIFWGTGEKREPVLTYTRQEGNA